MAVDQLLRKNFWLVVLPLVATAALLNAQAVTQLVGISLTPDEKTLAAPPPVAKTVPMGNGSARNVSAEPILNRNPFDHVTGALRVTDPGSEETRARDTDPRTAPVCEGVRPLVVVGDEDQTVAFASLEVGGQRVLRRRGGDVGARRVAYVGRDRVWLEGAAGLCQARLFAERGAAPMPDRPPLPAGSQTPLELEIGKHIVRNGPNELTIDRPTVNRILDAQAELMKARIAPEKDGDRVVGMKVTGIKPGSVLAQIGIENGDRLETVNGYEMSDPQKMLEAYARLRLADRLVLRVSRGGRPTELHYTIQ